MNEGCILLRPGSRHDIYINPKTGQKQPVPRHTENGVKSIANSSRSTTDE
jgi:hypothetical protein